MEMRVEKADVGGHGGGLGRGGCGTGDEGKRKRRGERERREMGQMGESMYNRVGGRTRMASSSESGNVSAMSTNEQASSRTRIAPRKLASPLVEPPGAGERA